MIIRMVSTPNILGAEVISDVQRAYTIKLEKRYVLKFTNGEVTLKAFKELFLLDKEILFYVVNFEFFLYKMSLFKHYRIEFVTYPDGVKDERIERYKSVEKGISGEWSSRGVDLSFTPDVFASISSSLLSPELYLSELNLSGVIYKTLVKKLEYKNLKRQAREVIETHMNAEDEFDEEFDKHLKSLVFTGVVKMKDGLFYRWN
ncbi:hypothetical protein EROM_010370 [Encephalitozoon romaleae SJ-2008]|uniref:Uncharacterized protein n=1 Tax=Encephalitozoon romaleae (strain SJ-2008) TaxID=1178016 RepID=I7APZ5_ENCRO|nr:hypothetical protein EROM_010370 [Encephalitozoon romaleae SJ-2008]AFN82382.1 hypothetical protein EROM_010370 [Encephalitozoon romaleae SJ-2008]